MTSFLRPTLVLVVGIGQVAFPFQANGSMINVGGKTVGSALIGQDFARATYFHGRPSALTGTDPKNPAKTVATPHDASESGASNLAPTTVPPCATASRPTPRPMAAATYRAARHLPEAQVSGLVAAHTRGRLLGVFGEPRVNVLELNVALDRKGAS